MAKGLCPPAEQRPGKRRAACGTGSKHSSLESELMGSSAHLRKENPSKTIPKAQLRCAQKLCSDQSCAGRGAVAQRRKHSSCVSGRVLPREQGKGGKERLRNSPEPSKNSRIWSNLLNQQQKLYLFQFRFKQGFKTTICTE